MPINPAIRNEKYTGKYSDPIGNHFYFQNGQYHRTDGPAIEYTSGMKCWYFGGKLHREDGPARIYPSGFEEWWIEGYEIPEPDIERIDKIVLELSLTYSPYDWFKGIYFCWEVSQKRFILVLLVTSDCVYPRSTIMYYHKFIGVCVNDFV